MTSVLCIADTFKVSHGVVVAITERVCRAIIECLIVFTSWPEPSERISLSARFQEMTGFDGVVGVIDGTHIPFLQRLNTEDADAMYTYKRRYAIVVQGVADCDMRIRNYFIMSTASVHDASVYARSPLNLSASAFLGGTNFCSEMLHIHVVSKCSRPFLVVRRFLTRKSPIFLIVIIALVAW